MASGNGDFILLAIYLWLHSMVGINIMWESLKGTGRVRGDLVRCAKYMGRTSYQMLRTGREWSRYTHVNACLRSLRAGRRDGCAVGCANPSGDQVQTYVVAWTVRKCVLMQAMIRYVANASAGIKCGTIR